MALTVVQNGNTKDGGSVLQIAHATVTFDASYATGGEAFDPTADLDRDFNTVYGVHCANLEPVADGGGYVPQWDQTNGTIMVFEAGADGAALDEVAATTDLSALNVSVIVIGN